MENKKMIIFSIGIVIILVIAAFSGSAAFGIKDLPFNPNSNPAPHQILLM